MQGLLTLMLVIVFSHVPLNVANAGEAANQCRNNCDTAYQNTRQDYCFTNPFCIDEAEQQQYACYAYCDQQFGPANRTRCYTDEYGHMQCYPIDGY